MKHSTIAGLFITAAMLASPVFAADKDLCASNIQAIEDALATAPSTSESAVDNIKKALKEAKEAQAAGDDKKCISETTSALKKIETRNPANKS